MSRAASPATQRPYGVQRVCAAWDVQRSSFYATLAGDRSPAVPAATPAKRGPKVTLTDDALLVLIRADLSGSPFQGGKAINRTASIVVALFVFLIGAGFSPGGRGMAHTVSAIDEFSNLEANRMPASIFEQLDLYANVETIGVLLSGVDLPKTAQLMYRREDEANWRLSGHPLMRIDDGRLVGSLFGLLASTTYQIRVLDGSTEISGSVTTSRWSSSTFQP